MDKNNRDFLNGRIQEARAVLRRCIGKKGIWASSARYKYACWTRDFVISMPALLREGYAREVETHLEWLCKLQRKDGKIPVLFWDNFLRWLWREACHSIRQRRISFPLVRFFTKDGIVDTSPWTRDSELMFIIGMCEYGQYVKESDPLFVGRNLDSITKAMRYVEENLVQDGFIRGADWRDTRPDLDDKALLSLNCFLYKAYALMNRSCAKQLAERISNDFLVYYARDGKSVEYYRDFLCPVKGIVDDEAVFWTNELSGQEFDPLGNALVISCDIVPKKKAYHTLERFFYEESPYGYVKRGVSLSPIAEGEAEIMRRVDTEGLVFPFLTGYAILAALSLGAKSVAERGFMSIALLEGMYEWYDPRTGKPGGSPDQLWTAALFLDAAHALGMIE